VTTSGESIDPVASWRLRQLEVSETSSRIALLLTGPDPQAVAVRGQLTGPFCEYAATLPADYYWRMMPLPGNADPRLSAFAVEALDTCLWEPDHPFLYRGSWRHQNDRESHEFHIGWRTLSIKDGSLLLNGQPYRFQGLAQGLANPPKDKDDLRKLQSCRCNLLYDPRDAGTDLTDEFGPFRMLDLPAHADEAMRALDDAGPTRPSIGVWLARQQHDDQVYRQLRVRDPAVLFAEYAPARSIPNQTAADCLLIHGALDDILAAPKPSIPWIAAVGKSADMGDVGADRFEELRQQIEQATQSADQCLGWLVGRGW